MTQEPNWVHSWLRASAATADRPQVKLEPAGRPVSIATLRRIEQLAPDGPSAVAVCNTAWPRRSRRTSRCR